MGNKLTIEFVKESFEAEGYEFLTKEYINAHQKLDYICPNGCRHSISWCHWKDGVRCPCYTDNVKPTIDFIRAEFKKEDYELLTTKYINNKQKLEYICPEEHKHSITWSSWNCDEKYRCPYCYGNAKLTIEFIRSKFEEKNCELLTTEYVNNRSKLDYVCKRGHTHSISWNDFSSGYGCPECFIISIIGSKNCNWKGGIAKDLYCLDWTKDLKELVKVRDGYKCLNPDCIGKDSMISVHHIDYNKKSCDPENLITVCRSCNSRANFDRKWHQAWYQAILNKRYGYVYNGS